MKIFAGVSLQKTINSDVLGRIDVCYTPEDLKTFGFDVKNGTIRIKGEGVNMAFSSIQDLRAFEGPEEKAMAYIFANVVFNTLQKISEKTIPLPLDGKNPVIKLECNKQVEFKTDEDIENLFELMDGPPEEWELRYIESVTKPANHCERELV